MAKTKTKSEDIEPSERNPLVNAIDAKFSGKKVIRIVIDKFDFPIAEPVYFGGTPHAGYKVRCNGFDAGVVHYDPHAQEWYVPVVDGQQNFAGKDDVTKQDVGSFDNAVRSLLEFKWKDQYEHEIERKLKERAS